eukprot:CAMPEP_0197050780 /NCGR_PEP_ID=MMETSP1384-20130603/25603_1 /TAXON_ID=29189 /ORGANISM="Ammonia sp." /LENGTH=243 /DNA_ID=CAMNT_0042483235 /DNA_START=373 /DNA_END=1104 /DNA_ORIENTATION=+
MTSVGSLRTETNSYHNLCRDPELTTNYQHLMHVVDHAIEELNKPKNRNIHIIEEEEQPESEDLDAKQSEYSTPTGVSGNERYGVGDHTEPDLDLQTEPEANLIKQQSLELCTEEFSKFVAEKVAKKESTKNMLWQQLDVQHKGYIETVDELANGIGLIVRLYKQHRRKQAGGTVDIDNDAEKQRMQKQAEQIALWTAKSYGSISGSDTDLIEFRYHVTKSEFFSTESGLPKWITAYATAKGSM